MVLTPMSKINWSDIIEILSCLSFGDLTLTVSSLYLLCRLHTFFPAIKAQFCAYYFFLITPCLLFRQYLVLISIHLQIIHKRGFLANSFLQSFKCTHPNVNLHRCIRMAESLSKIHMSETKL